MAQPALQLVGGESEQGNTFQDSWRNAAEIRKAASPLYEAKVEGGHPDREALQRIADVLGQTMDLQEDESFPVSAVAYFLAALEQNPVKMDSGLKLTGLSVAAMSAEEAASSIMKAAGRREGLAGILEHGRDSILKSRMFREQGWVGDETGPAAPVVSIR